ncbi:MAG: 16S rRNA (cytidine(1402)-2'-O)-methyltransferase [Lachnospiraceae bacterium]
MAGMLYLCATPIGNMEDITLRVLRTLQEADLIAAEDTRNSIRILNHYDIKTPMTSYHEYNKYDKAYELIAKMKSGQNIALVTDAGTPGISDPGEELVRFCFEEGIEVTSLPGACACITALTVSGLSTRRFCFEAFLPKIKKERTKILSELVNETRTIILYESPHHLKRTLKELKDVLGERNIAVTRELTKKFEEKKKVSLSEAISYYEVNEPRGEYVLVIEGMEKSILIEQERQSWMNLSMEEHMSLYEEQGISKKECMKLVARDRGVSKREIYQQLLNV